MEQTGIANRNFDSISPSAKWILLMKGHTNIPFARQAAEIIQYPEKFTPDFDNPDPAFWGRTFHFESRYYSIDELLKDLPVTNILEMSSGFSFRGLHLAQNKQVHYIDTDLPAMIQQKKELVAALGINMNDLKGKLELVSLNALDENKFNEIAGHFPPGEIAIVNEGLLMYLDTGEKEKLCGIIRSLLKKRGGWWITADIYIKLERLNIDLRLDEKSKQFFEEQKVEEKKFESFEEAGAFFNRMGFVVDKEAETDYAKMTALPYLMKNSDPEMVHKMKDAGKMNATWRLRLAD